MSTSLPIQYAHTIDYFSKGIDQGGPTYKVQYRIANWSDADNFVNALVGASTRTGTTTVRYPPHSHPLSPNLYCVSANVVEGLGSPVLNANGYPNYDGGALIQAEYRAPKFDFAPAFAGSDNNSIDPTTPILWCTQEIEFGSETYTINKSTYTYSSGPASGQTTNVPAKFSIPLTTLVLTFHRLPYLPMTTVRNLRGRVNTTTFLGAVAGTVLFKGARTTREYNSDGSICQKLTMTFEERDALHPWNSLPSQTSLTWYPVADSGGTKLFPTADLTPLVQF